MKRPLDRESPIPIYHQISEAIRYQIATGALRPGAVLPPLREAARLWGANLHTVRRAYAELARDRLVATRVPNGTVVLERRLSSGLDRFLGRVVTEARHKHGLDLSDLIGLLRTHGPARPPGERPRVYVSECSETQSQDLADQLMGRWDVTALPWPIDRPEPPSGHSIVATYFHYQEVAQRWPARLPGVRFMAISPDPALEKAVRRLAGSGKNREVVLWEKDASMLENIAQDVSRILPADRYRLKTRLIGRSPRLTDLRRRSTPALFSPRVWGELPEEVRSDPGMLEVRYLFNSWELEETGTSLGWKPR